MLENYLNSDGEALMNRINEEEKSWAWKTIELIKARVPKIDSWTTGGIGHQYIDIRFGKKPLKASKGLPAIYFSVSGGQATFHVAKKYRDGLKDWNVRSYTAPAGEALEAWVDTLAKQLSKTPLITQGEGNIPLNYRESEISKMPDSVEDSGELMEEMPLNRILYGPPGTGKTFHAITHAMSILEPTLVAAHRTNEKSRAELVAAFQDYLEQGQVIFCTFHQSFSYEDFVEGLRANAENGQLNYVVESGIFKDICDRASRGMVAAEDPFDKALVTLLEHCANAGPRLALSTITGKQFDIEYEGNKTFRVFPKDSASDANYYANVDNVRNLYQGAPKNKMYNPSYVEGMFKYLKEKCGLPPYQATEPSDTHRRKFVIIIDEINRGNVSRIFGELITLIEPSKRIGEPEELSVKLPYSKKSFGVPSNVYLIGTMNTADRSLADLDIALRRRFAFEEMPPLYDELDNIIIEDISVGELLRTINLRIEMLLDRDHCIGHAYFIKLTPQSSLSDLAFIFEKQIIPLLQEYFFEDWERIRWIFNDHQKTSPAHQIIVEARAIDSVRSLFGPDVAQTLQTKRWKLNAPALADPSSFIAIIKAARPAQ